MIKSTKNEGKYKKKRNFKQDKIKNKKRKN